MGMSHKIIISKVLCTSKGNTSGRQLSKEREAIQCFCPGFLLTLNTQCLMYCGGWGPWGVHSENDTPYLEEALF